MWIQSHDGRIADWFQKIRDHAEQKHYCTMACVEDLVKAAPKGAAPKGEDVSADMSPEAIKAHEDAAAKASEPHDEDGGHKGKKK